MIGPCTKASVGRYRCLDESQESIGHTSCCNMAREFPPNVSNIHILHNNEWTVYPHMSTWCWRYDGTQLPPKRNLIYEIATIFKSGAWREARAASTAPVLRINSRETGNLLVDGTGDPGRKVASLQYSCQWSFYSCGRTSRRSFTCKDEYLIHIKKEMCIRRNVSWLFSGCNSKDRMLRSKSRENDEWNYRACNKYYLTRCSTR